MYHILGLAFDGFQSSGISTTFDVFNVVNTLWQQRGNDTPLYQCHLLSAQGERVTASNGMTILADTSLDAAPEADLIIIPGLHHIDGDDLLHKLSKLKTEKQWLQHQHQQAKLIAANCSGVFLLAETGALEGEVATTAWWLGSLFKQRYPKVTLKTDTLLTENPHNFCTGAMAANIGVMLQIVERQVGRQLALDCAKTMLIDANQSYASPYLFMQEQSDHQDSLILAVESWMQRHMTQPLDLKALAELHHVSERTLSRRFQKAHKMSPSEYLQKLRLEHTKLLLETTNLNIEQLVERAGYSSPSSLRRLFKNTLGLSPREYRSQLKTSKRGKEK